MKNAVRIMLLSLCGVFFISQATAQEVKYKCMLQMSNYDGLGAYVVVSLIDAKGNYEKTLYMMGPDKQGIMVLRNGIKNLPKRKKI